MKEIPLTKGKVALVDDADYAIFGQVKWCLNSNGYAVRSIRSVPRKQIIMHREILAAPPNLEIDHINGDRLDNRRANLRVASRAQNAANRKVRPHSSAYKGVRLSWGKWEARIMDGRYKTLGRFDTEREAAVAYNRAAAEIFGEYARLNDVGDAL